MEWPIPLRWRRGTFLLGLGGIGGSGSPFTLACFGGRDGGPFALVGFGGLRIPERGQTATNRSTSAEKVSSWSSNAVRRISGCNGAGNGRPRCASVTNQSRNDRNVPRQRRFDLKADRIGAIVQQSPPSSVRRQPIRSDDHQHDVGLPDRLGDGFSEAIVLRYDVDPK